MKTRPLLVAIVGGSGSGKTWLADKLCAELVGAAGRLTLDDFYRDRSHLPAARRGRINFDHPRAIDWESFERVLRQCLAGETARVPHYDFGTHSRLARSRVFRPHPIILVDGLWLLHRRTLRKLFAVSIFLSCSGRMRLRRRLARDLLTRNRSAALVREQFRLTVAPMHVRHVEPQRRWANLRIREIPTTRRVKSLAERLRNMSNMVR